MRIVCNIMLVIGMGIILLHSAVPHGHRTQMTPEEHQEAHAVATNLVDMLGLAFHHGDEENLQYYLTEPQITSSEIPVREICNLSFEEGSISPNVQVTASVGSYSPPIAILYDDLIALANGLRGPPVFDFYV